MHKNYDCCVSFYKDGLLSNWTIIGSPAKCTQYLTHPTMSLNFGSMDMSDIRATVVHQFGHALGLGHALMRPEEWGMIKPHLNIRKMISNNGVREEEDLMLQWTGRWQKELEWRGKQLMGGVVNYDQESIMQYR